MAKNVTTTPAPTPGDNQHQPAWVMPSSDQEFEFKSVQDAPGWIDKNWAGFDRGPALAVPAGDLFGDGPYHTTFAHVGDKVVFTAARGATPAKLTVIPREPGPGEVSRKPPQQSPAAVEDMLKLGIITGEDLGPDGRAQIAGRSPRLAKLVETGEGAPENQVKISDVVKIDD